MTTAAELPQHALNILNSVIDLCEEASQNHQPLEVDPHRARLFEYFVTAEASGYVHDDAEFDLSADGLCRLMGERWGVDEAARDSVANQQKMDGESLARMRLMWSVMRMWMEWTYAWSRWEEFHPARDDNGDESE